MARICEIREIPLEDLEIGKGQVRLRDVGKEIDELADSIAAVGLIEPIVVCPSESPVKYEIITGQRRYLAHQELKKPSILAAVLDERVDEITAKVISVTENLVRRDLSSRDLIDVCTELYRKYGSVKAVAKETGLPEPKVSLYVKFEQLVPALKKMVTEGEVRLPTALRAQKAASVSGEVISEEAVELAKEMSGMSGAQQKKIVQDRASNPDQAVDEVIEHAKKGGKVTQIVVTLTSNVHTSLASYAEFEDTSTDDAARLLIESGLSTKGFLEE
jgi:ParB family chromosome partitioning protein